MKIEPLKLADLRPALYNPRRISDQALARLEKSIDEYGLVDPLIVNVRNMTVVGGHQRLILLKRRGVEATECVLVDLPPEKEKTLNIILNNQHVAGEFDFTKLADLLAEIDTGDVDVSALTGFPNDELERIANWTPPGDIADPSKEWRGMPDFQNEPLAFRTIFVHFKTEKDMLDFAKLLGEDITDRTKFVWFPKREKEVMKDQAFRSEEPRE